MNGQILEVIVAPLAVLAEAGEEEIVVEVTEEEEWHHLVVEEGGWYCER